MLHKSDAQRNVDERGGADSCSEISSAFAVVNPKPWASKQEPPNNWFKFYAGFNHEFAHNLLSSIPTNSRVADPWNGSGSTTAAAAVAGLNCQGFDLNPAMVVVARSRLATLEEVTAALKRFELLDIRAEPGESSLVCDNDPLLQWFLPKSVEGFRALENIIGLCVSGQAPLDRSGLIQAATGSPIGCVLYVALFQTVRKFTQRFQSSNPTWLQVPPLRGRLRPSVAQIGDEFASVLSHMRAASADGPSLIRHQSSSVEWASSTALPIEEATIDVVITSPPYCTRLDYAVATATDLAVLGIGDQAFTQIRRALLGTTTVKRETSAIPASWGERCRALLENIRSHHSKASKSYYLKSFHQYFDGLFRSIQEISRVTRDSGQFYVVVQDSYYKEIHVDLPDIVTEMAMLSGFALEASWEFTHSRTHSGRNPHTEQYRPRHRPRETVVCLKRNTR